MTYPIPKEIEYHEKIAFGLTAKQLLYVIITALLVFHSFNLLKQFLPFPFYLVVPYLIAMLGLGLTFFSLEDLILDLAAYHRGIKKAGSLDQRVKNFLGIESIKNGTIHLSNGGMRAILQVNPINFSMYDEEKRKVVISAFSSFVQQLSHPVQIHVKTVDVNLGPYFERHELEIKRSHPHLLPLFRDFVEFESSLIRENSVRNRLFYIIIPLEKYEVKIKQDGANGTNISNRTSMAIGTNSANGMNVFNMNVLNMQNESDRRSQFEKAAEATMERRIRIVQEGLERIGISSRRLETQELVSFLASYFEDRIVIGNDYMNAVVMLDSYIEKKKMEIEELKQLEMQSQNQNRINQVQSLASGAISTISTVGNKVSDKVSAASGTVRNMTASATDSADSATASVKDSTHQTSSSHTNSSPDPSDSSTRLQTKQRARQAALQTMELKPSDYLGPQTGLEQEIVEKFRKIMLKDLLCPTRIETTKDCIKINDNYYRVVFAQGFPGSVNDGWIERLITTRDNYDITIHIEPFPIETAKILLHNQIIKEQADYTMATMKGNPNPALANKLASTKELFDRLDKGEERLFEVSFYVLCKGKTVEELDYLTEKCKADLNSLSIIPKVPYYRMEDAALSVIPLCNDRLKKAREFPTSALSATFPFISSTPELHDGGILIAHDKTNQNPIIQDPAQLSNMHTVILAKSGAGKSYTAKLMISRMLMKGTRVYIIDPAGEYTKLCKRYKGQVINISRESENIINPLDLCGEEFNDKRISLMGLFSIITGGMTPPIEGMLDKALKETYARKGITEERDTWKNTPPTMSDLLKVLKEMLKDAQKNRLYDTKRTIQALIVRVEKYCKGGVYSFMDRQTKISADSNFIVFNIKDLPDEVKNVYMYIILDFVTQKAKADLERKAIVIDEGWSLLNQEKSAEYVLWLVKSSRKFNTGMIFITQEVNDLLGNKTGESILANSSIKILLAQDGSTIEALSEVIHLNLQEKNLLLTARKGEGLLILENNVRVPVSIIASPEEHRLITTNPDEIGNDEEITIYDKANEKRDQRQDQRKDDRKPKTEKPGPATGKTDASKSEGNSESNDYKTDNAGKAGYDHYDGYDDFYQPDQGLKEYTGLLNRFFVLKVENNESKVAYYAPKDDGIFDLRAGIFRKSDLSPSQIERCMDDGYVEMRINPFGNGGGTYYLVKPAQNETPEHAFFRYIVGQEAWKYSKEVYTNTTNGPDIEFKAPIGMVAVEIETGSSHRTEKELEEKFSKLINDYADYFIVVTNWELKKEYEYYGKVITRTEIPKAIESYFKNQNQSVNSQP